MELSKHYMELTVPEKKALIQEFFKVGGRKQGLSLCFAQAIHTKQAASEGTWSGYVTPGALMVLEGVPWDVSKMSPTITRL